MILPDDRTAMARPYLVESVNTGRQWRLHSLDAFFRGRKRAWYRIFKVTPPQSLLD